MDKKPVSSKVAMKLTANSARDAIDALRYGPLDALDAVRNIFCSTGKGGGIKATCGKHVTKAGEVLQAATRVGKVWKLANGKDAPEHIQKLGIPPAWNSVRINMDPKGTVLAIGKDAKGRTQSKYSATHAAKQAAAKFGRVLELRKKRASIFKELEQDAKSPELKDRADCLKLIMHTGMRPGSHKETKADYKSYGASTLEGRHVKVDKAGNVTLKLVTGKNKGKEVSFPIRNADVAAMLKARAASAGQSGKLFDITAGDLRKYSKSKDGKGFKTKDHRTALGTEVAIAELTNNTPPKTAKEYKAKVMAVAAKVASTLGNTPSVALKSYIDPVVFTHWKSEAGL